MQAGTHASLYRLCGVGAKASEVVTIQQQGDWKIDVPNALVS